MRRHWWVSSLFACAMLASVTACGSDSGDGGQGEPEGAAGDNGGSSGSDAGNSGSAGASGSGALGGTSPLGKAPARSFSEDTEEATFLSEIVGEYSVGIYRAPTDAETGEGKLIVAFDGSKVSMELIGVDGKTITKIENELTDRTCSDGTCVRWIDPTSRYPFAPAGGKDVFLDDYYAAPAGEIDAKRAIRAAFLPDGFIVGAIGLYEGYMFRNDMVAYGAPVPEIFSSLAGHYTAEESSKLCSENPLDIEIGAKGSIKIAGKSNVSCEAQEVIESWTGNDDFLVPFEGGYRLTLKTRKIGGSGGGGVVYVNMPATSAPDGFTWLRTEFGGAHGHIETTDGSIKKTE